MADPEAIVEELYATALPRLCGYGFVLTGSESEGEEIVQAAIVKTFVRKRRFENASHAEAYVRAAMRTLVIDGARRSARWRRAISIPDPVRVVPIDEGVVDEDEAVNVIRQLPPRVRVAVALRYVDDLTIAEAAGRMGVTAGAVKKYLSIARERLAPWWGDDDPSRVSLPVTRRARGGRDA